MKQTELLRSLINLSSELKPYEYAVHTKKPNEIYLKIIDILMCTVSKKQKKLILALDEITGVRLTNAFDDGVIAGIELANSIKNIFDNPNEIYFDMTKGEIKSCNFYYDEIYNLINKYEKHSKKICIK